MGKFNYLRSRYYLSYEYSHYIQYKNKNVYKYILFKLLSILLDEMFYSVKCYKLANKKCKYKYSIDTKHLSTIRLFIYKFFNFVYHSKFGIFIRKNKILHKNINLYNLIKNIRTNLRLYTVFQADNSSYILFIRLLLLLLFRRDMISFSMKHVRNIAYQIRKISNYTFFDMHKKIMFNISRNILSYDLRKLIMSSIFNIRRYANRYKFLNKKPILNKISFLIVLSTKRFDKLKRSKPNRTFYYYKLQFKQFFKNIYNFKTTKRFNKYVRKIDSKLTSNINVFKVYLSQIHTFVNDNFFFYKSINVPEIISINGYSNDSTGKYHHLLVGDQIEVIYNTYKYAYSIRKLHISFLLSQLFYNCCSNFFFIKMKKKLLDSKGSNNFMGKINLNNYYNYLNNYISFINRNLNDNNMQNMHETIEQVYSVIDIQKEIIQIKKLQIKCNVLQTSNIIKSSLLNTNIMSLKKKKNVKNYYIYLIRTITKAFNSFNILTYKYYIRKKRYKKLRNLCKKYIVKSKNKIYKQIYFLFFKKLRNIKKSVYMHKYSLFRYNQLLNNTYKILNIHLKNNSNKYGNYYYHLVENNNNIFHSYTKLNSFSGIHILLPMLVIYKYYVNLVTYSLNIQVKIVHNSDSCVQYCEYTQLLDNFINSHMNYVFSTSKYNPCSNLDLQINFSITKQLSSNIYKNFLVSLFMKLFNSIFSLFFIFNNQKTFQINLFLMSQLQMLESFSVNNINSILNTSCLSNISKQVGRFNIFNINNRNDYLSKIYYFLCNYLISKILFIVKNARDSSTYNLNYFYTSNKFINKSIMNKFKLLPELICNVNMHHINKSLRMAFIVFKSATRFRKLFNNKRYPFIIFRKKEKDKVNYFEYINELEEYVPKEIYLCTDTTMEVAAELLIKKQKKNSHKQLINYKTRNFKLFNSKFYKFIINNIVSVINYKTIFSRLKFFDTRLIHRIQNKYKYIFNKINIFKPYQLYKDLNYVNYYYLQINKHFQTRQYHITVPLLDFDFKLALKDIKVNRQKSVMGKKIKNNAASINKIINSYRQNKRILKVTIFNSTFKFFINHFKSPIRIRYKTRYKKFNLRNINLNLRKRPLAKHIVFKKLYFEYLDKLDLYLNINVSITLFTLLNDILNIIAGVRSLDSPKSKLFIYNIKNQNINKFTKHHLNFIFDNFLMTYYYDMCSSLMINIGNTSIFNKVKSSYSLRKMNTALTNIKYKNSKISKHNKKRLSFNYMANKSCSKVSKYNKKKLSFNYRANKSYSKIFLNKRYFNFFLSTKYNNLIFQYNYLKYLKQCFTRLVVTPLYYKLTFPINNIKKGKLKINSIKEYLQFRTQYIDNLHVFFKLNSYLHIIRKNKLKFILHSDPYFTPTAVTNIFNDIDITKVATDIRYLFNEKNYHSILTKYR